MQNIALSTRDELRQDAVSDSVVSCTDWAETSADICDTNVDSSSEILCSATFLKILSYSKTTTSDYSVCCTWK